MENYISTTNETIGTAVVPSGSWNAVIRVDNPRIKEGLLTGEFGGVSLNNRIAPRCQGDLTGIVRYQDVADALEAEGIAFEVFIRMLQMQNVSYHY